MALLWSLTVSPLYERRGKAGGAEERPVDTETEELDHEDSVDPWPLFPLRKREIRRGSENRTQ